MTIKLVRDDIDHTKCARLCLPTVYFAGQESPSRSHTETAQGRVYATTTCKVVIDGPPKAIVMDPDDARKLARALLNHVQLAESHDRYRRGELTRKIVVSKGTPSIVYLGETIPLRIQRHGNTGRYPRRCNQCGKTINGESWVSHRVTDKGWGPKPRVGEHRICLDCYPKLIVDALARPKLVDCRQETR